jgi:hypothetical protein
LGGLPNTFKSVKGTATLVSIIVGIFITAVIGWFAIILPWFARLEREENIAFLNRLSTIVIGYNYPIVGKMAEGLDTLMKVVKQGEGLRYDPTNQSSGRYFSWSSPEEILVFFRTNLEAYNDVISSVSIGGSGSSQYSIRFTSDPKDIFALACDQVKGWRLARYDKSLIFSNFNVTFNDGTSDKELPRNKICGFLKEVEINVHSNSQAWPIFVFVKYKGVLQDLLSSFGFNSNNPNVAVVANYPRLQLVQENGPLHVVTRVFLTIFSTNWPSFNPSLDPDFKLNDCLHPVLYSYFNVTARFLFFLNLLFNVEDTHFLGYFQARSSQGGLHPEVGLHPIELTPNLPDFSLVLEGEGDEDQPSIFTSGVGQSGKGQLADISGVRINNWLPHGTVRASSCFNQLESFGGLLLPTAKLSSLLSVSPSAVRYFLAQTKANLVFFGPTIRTITPDQAPTVLLSNCTSFTSTCLQLSLEDKSLLLTPAQERSSSEPLLGNFLFDALLLAAFSDWQYQQIVDIFPRLDPFESPPYPSHFLLKFFPSRFQVIAQKTLSQKTFHTASFPNFVVEESPNGDPNNPDFFFYSRFIENLGQILNLCRLEQDIDWLNDTLQGIDSGSQHSDSCGDKEKNFLLSLERSFNQIALSVLVNYLGLQLRP